MPSTMIDVDQFRKEVEQEVLARIEREKLESQREQIEAEISRKQVEEERKAKDAADALAHEEYAKQVRLRILKVAKAGAAYVAEIREMLAEADDYARKVRKPYSTGIRTVKGILEDQTPESVAEKHSRFVKEHIEYRQLSPDWNKK